MQVEIASSLGRLIQREAVLRNTPVLTVDLDAVERNITRFQRYCDTHGFAFRPHIKTHKLPAIAHMQMRAGAVGITCQKLGEAEVMAAAGLDDILITFPLVGEQKAERLARLARGARLSVVADSAAVAEGLSSTLARLDIEVELLVECDTGFGRTGVQTAAEAADLAHLVESLAGLRFTGLMTYPTLEQSPAWLSAAKDVIESRGLQVAWISGGGTPTALSTHDLGVVTEIRAGTYVYGDRACIANGSVPLEDCALKVAATVVSRPTSDRAIIDAGSKTLTNDPVAGVDDDRFGLILEYPEAAIYSLHEEHGHVDLSGCSMRPQLGDIVTIIPNHACGTTNMHSEVVAYREGNVVAEWAVAARGRVR